MVIQCVAIVSDSLLGLAFLCAVLGYYSKYSPLSASACHLLLPSMVAEQEDSGLHISIQHTSPFPLLQIQSQRLNATALITSVTSSPEDTSGGRLNNLESFSSLGIV